MDSALVVYAETLRKAGFTIYWPKNRNTSNYFTYSRVVGDRECFGNVQRGYAWDGFQHHMPIKPSVENGSSMFVDGVPDGWDNLTVAMAKKVASPWNHNPLVGIQENYRDHRFDAYDGEVETP